MKFLYIFSILLVCYSESAFSDSIALPRSSANFSENKKIVCVNWLPNSTAQIYFNQNDLGLSEDEFSRQNYPESGVYEVSGRKLLWKFQLEEDNDCEPLDDGHHVVVRGPWASSKENLAYAFYKDGQLIKKYQIQEICNLDFSYSYSTSHFFWHSNYELDNLKKEISFDACFLKKHINVENGKMQSSISKNGLIQAFLVLLIPVSYLFIFIFLMSHLILPLLLYRFVKKRLLKREVAQGKKLKFVIKFGCYSLVFGYLMVIVFAIEPKAVEKILNLFL
ncbi:MAG: hypothetical protein WC635_12095 [Bacteriovorax sp.]